MTTTPGFADVDLSEVDLTDLSYFEDGPPYELFARMRSEASPHWNALTGDEPGFWSFTKAADIAAISRDPATFSSARGGVFLTSQGVAPPEVLAQVTIGMDPPVHTKHRNIVQAVFTPKMIRDKEAAVRARVTALIDDVIEKGACDFVDDIAVELSLIVIADMLGVPQDDRRQLFEWTNTLSRAAATGDPDLGMGALLEIGGYMTGLTAERKANPADDLVSRLIAAEVDGESLTEQEVTFFFAMLMFAGNDTTRNTASGGMRALIENDGERQKLVNNPDGIPHAVEEMLRWVTPVVSFTRVAQRDTEVGGHPIREGERVAMWYPAGSRDPAAIDDPDRFDVSRRKAPHQAFGGGGAHFCIGNALARLELRVLFEELMRRTPDMEFSGPITRLTSNFSNELTSMPVTFTPGKREGDGRARLISTARPPTPNPEENPMRTDITFRSGDDWCAGWLYRPEGFEGPRPLVVMGHGLSVTKEMRLPANAERFCAAGIGVLLFDYRHFGASGGEPRQLLDVSRQHADFRRALAYARDLDWVDPERVGLFGSSFAGGHVLPVGAADGRVAAIVSQCPFTDGLASVSRLGLKTMVQATVAGLRDQLTALRRGAPYYIPAAAPPGSVGVMTSPDSLPGLITMAEQSVDPQWDNRVAARLMLRVGMYRPGLKAAKLPCPALFCITDQDALAPAERTAKLAARGPRNEIKRYPIGHFDIYVGEDWERAVADQTEFLVRTLKP